jgi:hypothetical protein
MEVEDKTPEEPDPNDPVFNMALPASRLQQAERVRNTLRLVSSAVSKAKLRRKFRKYPDKTIRELARAYPMSGLYQVRPLALFDVTYAGSVCFIMSYTEYGGVSLSVFYDRPGHRYTDPGVRSLVDPDWIEPITLDEFEAIVKKDNPTVVLS